MITRAARRRRGAGALRAALSARRARRRRRSSGEAGSAREALELARAAEPDVVFLDVEMPGPQRCRGGPARAGARRPARGRLRDGTRAYAVDAFAVEAFDYLLKPVDPDRLARVVERLRERSVENVAPASSKVPVVAGGRHRAARLRPGALRRRPTATTAACTSTTDRISAPRRLASSRKLPADRFAAHPPLLPRQSGEGGCGAPGGEDRIRLVARRCAEHRARRRATAVAPCARRG